MTNFNNVGFEIKYPTGCKELTEGLRPDEIKRRLMDLIHALEEIKSQNHDITINDTVLDSVDNFLVQDGKCSMDDYKGLAYYLASESFLENEDKDIQIRIGVCLCIIISIFCPKNIFESFTDCKEVVKRVLEFLMKCLDEFSRIKAKTDKHYLNLYKILTVSCHIDLFHWYLLLEGDDGDNIIVSCYKTMFNIVRKLDDCQDQEETIKMITDALTALLSSSDLYKLPDRLVKFLLNYLVDKAVTTKQKQLASEIIMRCGIKLEDQIQSLLQSCLLKDTNSVESSDISTDGSELDDNDDVCSLDSYKRRKKLKREEKKAVKIASLDLTSSHTFQLIYEIFKISESIIGPILPILDVKLKSTSSSDRKRACRLLGKLFSTSSVMVMSNQSGLWDGLLGRFLDIDVEVREVCIKVARDLLRQSISTDRTNKIDELANALEKRSHDQEDNIRLQVVLAVVDILEKSGTVVQQDNLSSIDETLLTVIIDRSRDRSLEVRKAAYSYIGKLYRAIMNNVSKNNLDLGLDLLTISLRNRAEMLLNKILRLYQRQDVQDRIIVERLFNTCLVPYGMSGNERMRALFHCFLLSNDTWIKSIHELMKTQKIILNELSIVIHQIVEMVSASKSNNNSNTTTEMSTKLRENIKILSESLPGKDRLDNLTKLFTIVKSDSKLLDQFKVFINPNSPRPVVLKSIGEIKRLITNSTELGHQNNKKKSLVATAKCLLERCAPIIIDKSISQEIVPFLVSIMDKSDPGDERANIPLSRVLSVLQVLIIIYKHTVPMNDIYEYLVTVLKRFERKKTVEIRAVLSDEASSTPGSLVSNAKNSTGFSAASLKMQFTPSVEELALTIFTKLVRDPSSSELGPTTSNQFDDTLLNSISLTDSILPYFEQCCTMGGLKTTLINSSPKQQESSPTSDIDDMNLLTNYGAESDTHELPDSIKKQFCRWKYDCKVAKLAIKCLLGLYNSSTIILKNQLDSISDINDKSEETEDLKLLICNIEAIFERIVKAVIINKDYESKPFMLKVFLQLSLYYSEKFGQEIKKFAEDIVLSSILTEKLSVNNFDQDENNKNPKSSIEEISKATMNKFMNETQISVNSQIQILSIKFLGHFIPTLHPDQSDDKLLITHCLSVLQSLISSSDSFIRLAAGTAWLKLAQTQSLLSLLDVKGLYKMRALITDSVHNVRENFLRKLHLGLYRLRLPLDYMALFSIVPQLSTAQYADSEIMRDTRHYLSANIQRRREFLDRHPEYARDSRLFAVLPEYVLAFVIHMLAHDSDDKEDCSWLNCDGIDEGRNSKLVDVKQALWFVMEPLVKHGDNYSFIRKLLEKIKHAVDSTNPDNLKLSQKLHIASDIALGLLLSRQTNPVLRDYPVELRLPRTRYTPSPNNFTNPDFSDLIIKSSNRPRIQFSPPPRNKVSLLKQQMPPILIKGVPLPANTNSTVSNLEITTNVHDDSALPIKRSHKAQIKVALPEQEQEILEPSTRTNTINKKRAPKRKHGATQIVTADIINSKDDDEDLVKQTPISVSKKGRICKSNALLLKDMVSPNKIHSNYENVDEIVDLDDSVKSPTSNVSKKKQYAAKARQKQRKSKSLAIKGMERASVILEGQVSVSVKRLEDDHGRETETEEEDEIRPKLNKSPIRKAVKIRNKTSPKKPVVDSLPKRATKSPSSSRTSIRRPNISNSPVKIIPKRSDRTKPVPKTSQKSDDKLIGKRKSLSNSSGKDESPVRKSTRMNKTNEGIDVKVTPNVRTETTKPLLKLVQTPTQSRTTRKSIWTAQKIEDKQKMPTEAAKSSKTKKNVRITKPTSTVIMKSTEIPKSQIKNKPSPIENKNSKNLRSPKSTPSGKSTVSSGISKTPKSSSVSSPLTISSRSKRSASQVATTSLLYSK